MCPLAEFKQEVREFAEYIKDTPPAQGFHEVYYPGEIEWRTEGQRRQEGIYVEDDTWEAISALITEHKLEDIIGQP